MNRAVNDDVVAVEILPESEWAAPSAIVLKEEEEEEKADEEAAAEVCLVTYCYCSVHTDLFLNNCLLKYNLFLCDLFF